MARGRVAASWHESFAGMFLHQGDRHQSWLQIYAPLLAGFQGALGILPCRDARAADVKPLTVAFWYKIVAFWYKKLREINFFDGLMQTINDGLKTIKGYCRNPQGFIAGSPSSSVAPGQGATIFQILPDIAGLPSAVAWPHPTAEGVPSTIEESRSIIPLLQIRNRPPKRCRSDYGNAMKISANQVAYPLLTLWLLFTSQAIGQVSQIAPEWKAYFQTTPVIENCVFEREIPTSNEFPKGETNLFQFRYQENAFLFRQIRNLDDISSNNIPILDFYAGRFESNCWSIERTSDTYGKLVLIPNADNIWRKMPNNGNESSVYIGERMLFATLYFGISELNPKTIEWTNDNKFTALNVSGQKILGEITEVSQGRPTVLEWRIETARDKQFRFVLEYKYDSNFDLSYFPSEIRLLVKENGVKELAAVYKVLILKTSTAPLEKDFFDPKRYFIKPQSQFPRVSTILFSNNESYDVSDGHLQKVLPASMIQPLQNGEPIEAHPKLIRFAFLSFFVASIIGLLFILKRTKTNNKTNEREDQ